MIWGLFLILRRPVVGEIKFQTLLPDLPLNLVSQLIDFLNKRARLALELRFRCVRQIA